MHVVTIAARNYLPFTRLLARSFKAHNPQDTFVVLMVDAEPGEVPEEPEFEVTTPADLPLDPGEFQRLAFFYDVTELSTALKPWALEMLLLRGAETAVYLDPDIYVFGSLSKIAELSAEHGIVLTPHAIKPIPRDGLRPTEADIMGSGVYNLGFIGVGKDNVPMLHWWQERLRRDSIAAPEQMLFTDQRWIDLVPGLWDCAILRDPGYNVAYWNLDSRPVERRDGALYAGGHLLRFFHFSGYRPETPWILSKYVADNPRVVLSEHPVVAELCEDYGQKAMDAGMTPGQIAPYRYNRLSDGTSIGKGMRRIYRDAVLRADKGEAPYPPLAFDPETEGDLVAWFTEPQVNGLSRLLVELWHTRPDLQGAFPWALQGDSAPFLQWAARWGVAEREVPPAWVRRLRNTPQRGTRRTATTGVNLAGYFAAELGMGQGGRLLIEAVKAAGLPYATISSGRTLSRQQATFAAGDSDVRYPVNVAFVNADQFPLWAADVGPDLLEGRYTIGVWAWEVDEFPDFAEALSLVDEIWGISTFVRDAVAARTDKPVHVIPLPIPPAPEHIEPLDRAALGLTDDPYFLFVFDYFSVLERKNPIATIDAFTRAFAEGEGPQLVIKTINGHLRRIDRDRVRQACAGRSDIHLVEDYLSGSQLRSLMAHAAAYVSLHRSEGYGLTMSEAMALGRPVIATGYSGNLDFMTQENSLLVPYELVPVGPGVDPYPASASWAEPDIAVAAAYLRRIIEDPEFARELGERARASVAKVGDPSIAARFVSSRIEAIMADLRRTRRRARTAIPKALRRRVAPVVNLVRRLLGASPDQDPPGLVRRAARRALRVARRLRGPLRNPDHGLAISRWQIGSRLKRTDVEAGSLGGRLEELRAVADATSALMHDVSRRVDETTTKVAEIDFELAARPFTAEGTSLVRVDDNGSDYLGFGGGDAGSYATFEDVFRGGEEFIRERLRPYVALLTDHGPVLDVGCGRGEMLTLLAEAGVPASGVDLDPSMLDRATSRGLDVVQADANEHLAGLPDGSLGAVVSFQFIEHLPPDSIRELMVQSARVLRPGGVFIAETVNPHSTAALKVFWLDLTHIRPLFPESLLLLAQECGFFSGAVLFTHGSGDLDRDLRICGEYAVVAYSGEA